MSAGTAMGIDLALVSTGVGNAQLPIGFIHTVPAGVDGEGEKTFIYVSTIASIGAALGVARADATYSGVTLSGVTEDDITAGFTVNDMTDGALGVPAATIRFGFAQRTGVGAVTGGAGAAGNTATTAAAGACAVLGALAVGATGIGNYTAADQVNLWCRG